MTYPEYCEKTITYNFFEPLNTITNFAFILAGILLLIQLKKKKQTDLKGIFLSAVLIIIGIGSFAWHFHRNDFNLILDSIPIALFVLSYLFIYLRFTSKKTWHLIVLFIGFFIYAPIITMLLSSISEDITGNGGAGYFSAISYFMVLQIYNYIENKEIIKPSLIIVLVFIISLSFRQVDLMICKYIYFGTHFIWHILNALTLYLMVRLLYFERPS